MNDREKLIELLNRGQFCWQMGSDYDTWEDCLADHLLTNGVTVGETVTNCHELKWIPVTERLPEADTCVLVITANGNFKTARCNIYRNGTEVCWATNDGLGEMAITHWMPLPQPPKT